MNVVVIGAGAAGLTAARHLETRDQTVHGAVLSGLREARRILSLA